MADFPTTGAPYLVAGGSTHYDGSKTVQGHEETFNQSRSDAQLATDGWTVRQAGSCDVTETSSVLQISTDNVYREWWGGGVQNYTAPGVSRYMAVPPGTFLMYVPVTLPATNQFGLRLAVRFGTDNEAFFHAMRYRDSGSWYRGTARGPSNNILLTATGSQAGWAGIYFDSSRCEGIFSENAVSVEPGDGDWTWLNGGYDIPDTWNTAYMEFMILAFNYGANPADTLEVGKVHLRNL